MPTSGSLRPLSASSRTRNETGAHTGLLARSHAVYACHLSGQSTFRGWRRDGCNLLRFNLRFFPPGSVECVLVFGEVLFGEFTTVRFQLGTTHRSTNRPLSNAYRRPDAAPRSWYERP
jgi:hypothetical protein